DRLGADGVRMLLGKGRKDESGDFTKGVELEANMAESLLTFLTTSFAEPGFRDRNDDLSFNRLVLSSLNELKGLSTSPTYQGGLGELNEIAHLAASSGYGYSQIRIDPSVVRGLEYYTGPVYEVELTFPMEGEDGKPVRFGSVGGGGRYDGLVARFRGEPVPATGFSIGVSRLAAALQHLRKLDRKPAARAAGGARVPRVP